MKSDVSIVMKLKRHMSAAYYYLLLRAKALRADFDERKNKNNSGTSLPVPPPLLRFRVHGAVDLESYLQVGQTCAMNIKDLLGLIGKDFYSFNNILDFGCGSGRVARYFHDRPASCYLCGTDFDTQAISWCQKHLPFARWDTNDAMPPTAYADGVFDFIYAISVFTHLDERMQFAWLHELKRISKPGGILILTVSGEGARSKFSTKHRAALSEKGFLYQVYQTGIFKNDELPAFYQTAHHTRGYIEDRWSQLFKIVRYVERGINAHQDAVILQNH